MTRRAFSVAVTPVLIFAAVAPGALGACLNPRTSNGGNVEAALAVDPKVGLPYAYEVPAAVKRATTVLEAEDGTTTGKVNAFGTKLHTPAAEASGRRFVWLGPEQSVSWRTRNAADGLVVRVSFPDSADGRGAEGELEVNVDGRAVSTLQVTSRFSWDYGKPNWGSTDVWSSEPRRGLPRHFWDEASVKLPAAIPVGATLALVNHGSAPQQVAIDFVELEMVAPPIAAPAGSLSFADYKPAADGVTDDTQKLERALADAAAKQRTLYVPAGTYLIASAQLSEGTVQGAGMWHTRFTGPRAQLNFTGGTAHVADLAIFGETATRNDKSDEGNAFTGRPGDGSSLERVWVEHMKCAFWVAKGGEERGPTKLRITQCRFRNLMADAVNLCNGTTESMVDNTEVRNSGDDSLAAWSPIHGGPPGGHNTFAHNLIQSPWVANGIALYGGGPFRVVGNTVRDTVTTGSGIYVAAAFDAHPFAGVVSVSGNTLVRCGAHESDMGGPTGAFRVLASDRDLTGAELHFENNTVRAPLESAVSIQGPHRITGLHFEGLVTENAALSVDVRPDARGEAFCTGVSGNANNPPAYHNPDPNRFSLDR
jgi:hypothetical protein